MDHPGLVDGVMFVLLALFERGRKSRIIDGVRAAPTDADAIKMVGQELDDRLEPLTTPEERLQVYRWIVDWARRIDHEAPRLRRDDFLGGAAVALIIILATLPVVVPFLIIPQTTVAVRESNLIALTLQFWLGCWWGRTIGANPYQVGAGVTCIGVILVIITIALGG